MRRTALTLLFLTVSHFACSSDASSGSPADGSDAGTPPPPSRTPTPPPGTDPDAGTDAEAPLPKQTEKEPNNGGTNTEFNAMTVPGEMSGAIDPANDVDLFGPSLSPGEMWEWTLTPTTADLAPHLTVFDAAQGDNPTRLAAGNAGAPVKLQHFVLNTGTFLAAVRDARNVPNASGKGGPTYGYDLVAKKIAVNAKSTFPSTTSATLGSLSSVDLYTFTGTSGKGCDIVINAARKSTPSTLDSRIALWDVAQKKTIGINDNAGNSTDSQLSSTAPLNGTYIIVVDNEGTNPADLSYDLVLTLKP